MTTSASRTLPLEDALQEAVAHHRAGRLDEAEQLYRAILTAQPTHADANHNLGVVAMQRGQPATGLPFIKSALDANPGTGQYWLSYIEALIQTGQTGTARQILEDAQQRGLHGAETDALAARLNRQAEGFFAAEPQHRYAEAMRLHRADKVQEAKEKYLTLLHLFPDQPDLLRLLGTAEIQLGHAQEGIALLSRSIQLAPHHAEAHNNLGNALQSLDRHDEALASYDQAIQLKPDYVEAYGNRGNALWNLGRLDEALASYHQVIQLRPDDAEACIRLGNKLEKVGRSVEALKNFDRAIQLQPDNPEAYWNKAHLTLRAGEYPEGWALYEKRWERWARKGKRQAINFSVPQWRGESSLQGKTILLHAEQGIGDTLQFCRYIKMVSASGAKVVLAVPPPLIRLLKPLEGADTVISDGDPFPAFDVHCPLMSLPLAFNTTLDTIPADIPYLKSDPGQAAAWKKKLGEKSKLRVGLAWSSGFHPNHPELWSDHARRNIPLAKLEFWNIPDVEFYSLQKGEDGEALLHELVASSWKGPQIIDLTRDLTDFADTAALIDNLDMVISVDTAVAHLAGAMGKPVWILTRFDACWRWLKNRADSPWYPTATLYRQSSLNDWSNVVMEVRTQLENLARVHGNASAVDRVLHGAMNKTLATTEKPAPPEISALLDIFNQGRYAEAAALAQPMTMSFPRHGFSWNVLGASLQQLGQHEQALAAMQQSVALSPEDALAHYNLGVVLSSMKHPVEAEACFRQAIRLKPEHAEAHYNLGIALQDSNCLAEAEASFREATHIKPEYAEAHNNLGILYKEMGRLKEAETSFQQALRIKPDYAEAYNNLGITLHAAEFLQEAEASYREAIRIRPKYAEAHNNLGITLQDLGRLEETEASFRRAIEIRPDYIDAYNNLGIALQAQGRLEEAETIFRQAIQVKPDDADAHSNLGRALMELGKLAEAESFLNRAMTLAPEKVPPIATALLYLPYQRDDLRFNRLEALYAGRESLSTRERINLDFAMGKAMETIGEYDRAFDAYEEGNRLHFQQYPYDETRDERLLEKTKSIFTAELINQYTELSTALAATLPPPDARTPIFIVGMMRSGSTLIEQILASHPAIFGAGELTVASRIADSVEILELLLQNSPNPKANLASLRQLGQEYLKQVWKLAPDPNIPCISDKQLENFCHLGLIHLMLPNAKIIHSVRDPMDTCFSCHATLFTRGSFYTYDQRALGRHYLFYRRMMQHWHAVLPPGRILDVRYEDNVADPEREARRILDYLELPWDPACLRFHETRRVVSTASVAQVRKPIYSSSVARWKHFEKHLGILSSIVCSDSAI